VLIQKGDQFKATGGPYWRNSSGEKVPMKAPGPYTFRSHCRKGKLEWVECSDRDGAAAVLHLAGRRSTTIPGLVCRPYKITGKKRKKVDKKKRTS